ncbi:hypothetical protein [Pseudomonas sp.]|uniref:hypothetical protein n=1 Tax=Pseudomonas sp. TaxID=306 RepID=UPI0028AD922A|nr:hypothetical protein [Pseudomonas sp.]
MSAGATLKFKASKNELRVGQLMPKMPVLVASDGPHPDRRRRRAGSSRPVQRYGPGKLQVSTAPRRGAGPWLLRQCCMRCFATSSGDTGEPEFPQPERMNDTTSATS